jgi:hypothetical protein
MMYSEVGKYSQAPRAIKASGAKTVRPGRGASAINRNRPRARRTDTKLRIVFAVSNRSKLYCSTAAKPRAIVDDSERLMKTAQKQRSSAGSDERRQRSAIGNRKMTAPGR